MTASPAYPTLVVAGLIADREGRILLTRRRPDQPLPDRWELPGGKMYLSYIPFPTEMCILCSPRTKKGQPPSCVKHCMADCIRFGDVKDLSNEAAKKARMVLWVPRLLEQASKT